MICLVKDIPYKSEAERLETEAIQYVKYVLKTGVNVKDKDGIPHARYSSKRSGAIYAVRVRSEFTSIAQFKREHKSYYKLTRGGGLRATGNTKKSLGIDKVTLSTSRYTSSDRLSNTKVQCTSCGNIFSRLRSGALTKP